MTLPAHDLCAWRVACGGAWQEDLVLNVVTAAASEVGPIYVEQGLEKLGDEYAATARNFLNMIDEVGPEKFIVRPYERSSFHDGDILADLLVTTHVDLNDKNVRMWQGATGLVTTEELQTVA